MNYADVRNALAAVTGTVVNVQALSLDDINAPCGMIRPDDHDLIEDFDHERKPTFIITFYVASLTTEGQTTLDGYLVDVPAALDADPTLSGAVSSAAALRVQNYGVAELDNGTRRFYSAELVVEVYE